MYKVRYHGNDQETKVKIAVFVKYGIVPVWRYKEIFVQFYW